MPSRISLGTLLQPSWEQRGSCVSFAGGCASSPPLRGTLCLGVGVGAGVGCLGTCLGGGTTAAGAAGAGAGCGTGWYWDGIGAGDDSG